MYKCIKTFMTAAVCFCSVTLFADNRQEIAKENYMSGNYQKTIDVYEEMLTEGEAPELYFNLGNAYYKSNQVGKAILNYERSLRMKPSYSDAKFNLKLLNQQIVDKIDPVEVFFLTQWMRDLRMQLSSNGWANLSIALFSGCLLFLLLYAFGRYRWLRKTAFFTALFFFLFSILTFVFAFQKKSELEKQASAIVMTGSVTVKSSPDESGTELFVLHEGTKITIKNTLGSWSEVSISDGNVGWIKNSTFEKI